MLLQRMQSPHAESGWKKGDVSLELACREVKKTKNEDEQLGPTRRCRLTRAAVGRIEDAGVADDDGTRRTKVGSMKVGVACSAFFCSQGRSIK